MVAGYTRFYCTLFLIIYFLNCFSVGKRSGHVPYRDSKLTRILQLSLGGNARTAIICTMSPALSHVEQSRNTLFFATCAKEVTNSAQVNMVCRESWSIFVLGSSFYRFNFFGEQFLCRLIIHIFIFFLHFIAFSFDQVISDKQLVKHLQKEVARLEAELRTPEPSASSCSEALLKEKELKIKKV